MPKKATLCFVRHKDNVLMINRVKPPVMGLWNAVGGHLEEGETAEECAKREIKEESGITVREVKLISEFTWNYDDEIGYAFLAELPEEFDESGFPFKTEEGIVDFMPIERITDVRNAGVIEDLRVFLKDIERGEFRDYHLVYDGNRLKEAIAKTKPQRK